MLPFGREGAEWEVVLLLLLSCSCDFEMQFEDNSPKFLGVHRWLTLPPTPRAREQLQRERSLLVYNVSCRFSHWVALNNTKNNTSRSSRARR